jgi:FkbM family methyltransferase
MPLITILKKITESLGYRMINSSVRWGVEMIDDLPKAVGQPADFKVVFDVGANRGQTLKRFLIDFPKAQIYSFEPLPASFRELQKVASTSEGRAQAFELGISSEPGSMKLRVFADSEKCTLETDLSDSLRDHESEIITRPVESLDHFCLKHSIEKIDLLKMDVEGHEMQALRGAERLLLEKRVQAIYLEFHTIGASTLKVDPPVTGHTDLVELTEFLGPLGYRMVTMYTDSIQPNESIGTYNALFRLEARS